MHGRFLEDLLRSAEATSDIDAATWERLRLVFSGASFEKFLEALQEIVRQPAAAPLVPLFVSAGLALATRFGPDSFLACVKTLLTDARQQQGREAAELFGALPLAAQQIGDAAGFTIWLRTVEDLRTQAPESFPVVLRNTGVILSRLSPRGFRSWVFNGLQTAEGDAAQRLAYFSHTDTQALAVFERNEADVVFADVERPLRAFCRALWNLQPALRAATIRPGAKAVRRSSFDGLFVQLPEVYAGYRGCQAVTHFFAATAHVGAHMVYGRDRFERGSLRPLQVALVGLIEDARVEELAIAHCPGLRRLWLQFHTARPGSAVSAELLMTRLSRALLDPLYEDDDPWVRKGVQMFLECRNRLDDPAISRHIGNLLGNDLGQMRIQFNPKSHVVEPSYRDDGNGLWRLDDPAPTQSEMADIVLESVRLSTAERDGEQNRHDLEDQSSQLASSAAVTRPAEGEEGVPVARHPEWDHVSGMLRHGWTTVLAYPPRQATSEQIDTLLRQYEDVERRIARLVQATKVSRPHRIRRQPEGDRLDLDSCISASIDRRAGLTPDHRVYETSEMLSRDLSVLLLLDVSESTRDRVKDTNTTVLAMERAAAALLAQAMHELDDPFAIHAFCSNGRSEVRYYRVKNFSEPFSARTRGGLAGLRGMMSTRLGAALRQAGEEIGGQATHRKLVLVITDGEPSDIDVPDCAYLVEDARRAVQTLAHQGVDVFCVGLESNAESALPRIFGNRNFLKMSRIDALPERLPLLYFRLTV